MAHWREVLPCDRFIEVDYEAVVDDLEGEARRLVAFLGLRGDLLRPPGQHLPEPVTWVELVFPDRPRQGPGRALPRVAADQQSWAVPVPISQILPGDLVFFHICCDSPDWVSHVGIYVGNGMMIDAPYPGAYVRMEPLNTPYWQSHWAGAGRVVMPPSGGGR